MQGVIEAADCTAWREKLAPFGDADCTFLPEYHLAYALRIQGSTPLLWHFEEGGERLIYPFLLTPVVLGEPTEYYDISSIYGYTGPVASSREASFLRNAWAAFDAFAQERRIIAEFIRFSPVNRNEDCAHPGTDVSQNRQLAASHLPGNEEELLKLLGSKTRNMLRKAEREGLVARELALPEHLGAFQALYEGTMERNRAPEFFWYDDAYWAHLLKLGAGLRLFGVFAGEKLVAASMAICHQKNGLYHLGASLTEFARLGAGNLSLFAMSKGLMESGISFVNMTGGRSTAPDDPLLLFKKSNATGTVPFYIGKRIVNQGAYAAIRERWQQLHGEVADAQKIIFWRH